MSAFFITGELENLLPLMEKVYDITWRKQINETVSMMKKIFLSIAACDIIVKGQRKFSLV